MSNEYMREYVKYRYHRRRSEWLVKLGGSCVRCNSVDNLTFDHVDRSSKSFDVGKAFAGWSEKRLSEELQKCQLLCRSCHVKKTNECGDHGKGFSRHGTYWMYRKYKCRCAPCIAANSEKLREWKERAKNKAL